MSRKTASKIFGICGIVGVVCQIVSGIVGGKSYEYEIEKVLDERENCVEEDAVLALVDEADED